MPGCWQIECKKSIREKYYVGKSGKEKVPLDKVAFRKIKVPFAGPRKAGAGRCCVFESQWGVALADK